jgi:hypothetical protein
MSTSKNYRAAAVLLLALALAAIAYALSASQERVAIQGPSALAVLPDRSVWLAVEDRLWHLDAEGHRQAVVTPREHGVQGLIANLVLHPNGQLVASVRDDPDLYFLDAATGLPRGRVRPVWPQDLARHGDRAITYAFHPDGRIAISTGGGHAVALFDAAGRFIARTVPGLYEFSNGLWWSGDRLWTTDTNRPALVELDGRTLAQLSRVSLRGGENGWRYLGMATGPSAAAAPGTELGSVVRFANGMIRGHVVQVLRSGEQRPYPVSGAMEPRDLKWRGDELLVVDGARYEVARYTRDRQPLPDFGDAAVREELAAGLQRRDLLQTRHGLALSAAFACLLLGAPRQQSTAAATATAVEASPPGRVSPWPSARRQALASLLVPGLGQWMQRRLRLALPLFLLWSVLLLAAVIPLAWTLWGPRAAVSPTYVLQVAVGYLVVCVVAAIDALRHG